MYVRALAVQDFRSYPSAQLELDPGVTALVGPNGQGKTNLVEAVGYLATLGSHRVAADAPLVRAGAERAVVRGAVVRDGRDTVLEVEITPGRANRARVSGSPVPRARDILGVLTTVLFAPEDLAIVKGDPAERRRFLDDLLVADVPRFAGVRSDYDRVLKQRNALLKSAGAARRSGSQLRTLDVWDSHLAQTGAELLLGRTALVAALGPQVVAAYDAVSDRSGPASVRYRGGIPAEVLASGDQELVAAALASALATGRDSDLDRGVTQVGPHRDDLELELRGLPARGYASHGESWSFALALRLAAYRLLRATGSDPVLILDDVFAELDAQRRASLAALVAEAEQVLVTAAVAADVPAELSGARVDVAAGSVRRVL